MATRHDLIHIDFVANAGKANAVLKSLEKACEDARLGKEKLDKQYADAKSLNAPKEVLEGLEKKLKEQTTIWRQLDKGVREYAKGIDTLSKGIKEFNQGTLDEMSPKFNKALFNAAKLAQSNFKSGTKEWTELQRVMDAAEKNVARAQEDAVALMKALSEGGSVTTQQLTKARDMLADVAKLTATNTAEWREYHKTMAEIETVITRTAETEKRLQGEMVTIDDALALSNNLTRESIALRHSNAEARAKEIATEREGLEGEMRGLSDKMVLLRKERDEISSVIELNEKMAETQEGLNKKIEEARSRKSTAEKERDEAQQIVDKYKEQQVNIRELSKEIKALEEERDKKKTSDERKLEIADLLIKKQEELNKAETEGIKEAEKKKAARQLTNAKNRITTDDDDITATQALMAQNESNRKTDSQLAQMRGEAAKKTKELTDATDEYVAKAQKITDLNRDETQSFIEMAQSQNLSIEKMEQAVGILQKRLDIGLDVDKDGKDTAFTKERIEEYGNAIASLQQRIAQVKADMAAAMKPMADRLLDKESIAAMSEPELQKAIAAAKAYQSTLKSGSDEQRRYTEGIIAANDVINKNSEANVRAAQEQEKLHALMKSQLDNIRTQIERGGDVQEAALKAQQNYWQRLVDDPKTAAESLKEYQARLKETKDLSEQLNKRKETELATEATGIVDRTLAPTGNEYATANMHDLDALIKKLKEYQAVIDDPKGTGEQTFTRTKQAIDTLTAQFNELKGSAEKASDAERRLAGEVVTVEDALKMANNASEELQQKRADAAKSAMSEIKADQETIRLNVENAKQELELAKQKAESSQQSIEAKEKELALIDEEIAKSQDLRDAIAKGESKEKELGLAQDEVTAARSARMHERGVWTNLNNDVISKTVKVDELKEQLGQTSSLKEQQKLLQDIKVAEDELTQAKARADEQNKKLELATKNLTVAEEKEQRIREELNAIVGGRDFEKEEERLDDLDSKHDELTESIKKEKDALVDANADVDRYNTGLEKLGQLAEEASKRETEAAIELAQATNVSEKQLSNAIKILTEARENATDPKDIDEYKEAIGNATERLKEMRGEWMSLAEAEKIAADAGTENFAATPEQLQKATQALERRRDAVIREIKAERDLGHTVDSQEKELAELTQKLRDLKFEQDNLNISQEKMRMLMKTPANAVNLDELKAAIKRADAELHRMEGSLGKNSKEYKELAAQVKNAKNVLHEMEGQAKAATSQFEKAWGRLKTYVGIYVGFNVLQSKITGTVSDLATLSDKMGEVRKTTGFTADEVGRLSENLKKLDVRTGLTDLLDISARAGQLGLKSIEDVQGFTEAANKLMIALPEMGTEAVTEMMKVALATGEVDKIRKQMQQGLIEGDSAVSVALEKVGSTIDQLRANSAAAAPAITDFVKRVGAVGAQSGISIDQVAALGATVDGLGMRVEMSATALSRMIPAIKNNAFDVARAIGMAPNELRKMFEKDAEGISHGMDAIIQIFEHIRDKGMSAEDIETMLGKGGMQEMMKELNQQGARAGIVFAGLSQNVDLLKQNLNTATVAYEENMAVQREFEKMNETTAAKWARLKNQLEEAFVGDTMQRGLGKIIDSLRWIVDFLTGNVTPAWNVLGTAIKAVGIAFAAVKLGLGGGLAAIGTWVLNLRSNVIKLTESFKAFYAANKANFWFAIATAVYYLGTKIWDAITAVDELTQEINRLEDETDAAVRHVNQLKTAFIDVSKKAEDAAKKKHELEEQTKALREEVEKLRKANDGSTESTEKLKKKEDELKEAEKNLKAATDESNKANNERLSLIAEINSKYSTYLGYMLSEKTAAEQVASAHQLIVAALREEMKQKGLNRRQDAVNKKYDEKIQEYTNDSQDELTDLPHDVQQRVMDQFRRVLTNVTYDTKSGTYTMGSVQGLTKGSSGSLESIKQDLRTVLADIVRQEAADVSGHIHVRNWAGKGIKKVDDYIRDIWGDAMDDGFGDWAEQYILREKDLSTARHDVEIETNEAHQKTIESAINDINSNADAINSTIGKDRKYTDDQIRMLAQNVNAIVTNAQKYGDELEGMGKDLSNIFGKDKDRTLANAVNYIFEDVDKETRQRILRVAQKSTKSSVDNVNTNINSIYDTTPSADSTDYGEWNVDELVARRDQMDKFKNVLRKSMTADDIKQVFAEDKALMKAIDEGKIVGDYNSVLNWWNTERKKIQEELKTERFSTNKGHWLDEKNGKGRKNRFKESDYALAELDRYYSKRKEELEQARIEENMTEETFNRQAELLEQEHLERRSKLRETFTAGNTKAEREMVDQFRKWWKQLQEQGKLDEVPWGTVESEWSKAIASDIGRNNLNAQKDLTELRKITVKHLNEIAKLVDKERPYDGITANLRQNLTKMDVLLADMVQEGPETDTKKLVKAETERLQFLLGEAEHAYSLTFDQLAARMREKGFGSWVDALMVDEDKKQQLMQNLRNTYDQIQEAIKKEASVIKKQVETQWNDILPGATMSMKDTFEKAISDLGLQKDSVSRANSLIGAGAASERVADRLTIKQMQMQLEMQQTYYLMMQKIGQERVRQLEASAEAYKLEAKANREKAKQLRLEGKEADADIAEIEARLAENQALQASFSAQHAQTSLNLAKTKELVEEEKQRVAIANQLEESQNRLYTAMKEWADLFASSLQSVFEASHAGEADYYNELAKLNLTGKGGPGAGTYVVIDNAGTSDAEAHYEYLDEREALERQLEIERQNAQAEAWRKVMDDLNQKMSEQITDWINASFQNIAIDNNTEALNLNTEALAGLSAKMDGKSGTSSTPSLASTGANPTIETIGYEGETTGQQGQTGQQGETPTDNAAPVPYTQEGFQMRQEMAWAYGETVNEVNNSIIDSGNKVTQALDSQFHSQEKSAGDAHKKITTGAQSMFAKMTAAANMYGIAYQAMSNDNLSTSQKFQLMAVQAAGQAAITSLTATISETTAETTARTPSVFSWLWSKLGWGAIPVFALFTGALGGLMGLAVSKITKSKSEIAQATGASASAGRLTTGMMTYAEGNVNEFSDPSTLSEGRMYNVDAADGKTYHARYMGRNVKTHITNGPEFHLAGEAGREMIIDAHTTRQITLNENEIWHAIQTLSSGGRLRRASARRSPGVRNFAEGNVDDFEEIIGNSDIVVNQEQASNVMTAEQAAALQSSIEQQNELLTDLRDRGIKAYFDVYGRGGLIDSYDRGKKEVTSHGEKY